MQKEFILAVIFGSLLGIVVAFGIYKANSSFKQSPQETTQQTQKSQNSNTDINSNSLVIASPNNFSVIQQDSVNIQGITKNNSYVIIINDGDINLLKTQSDGSFSEEIKLSAGINNTNLFSVREDSQPQKNSLTLVYTTQLSQQTEDKQASESATLDDKVNEKLAEATHSPTSYIGTITDITEGAFQLRDEQDEIKQVAITGQTTYSNIVKNAKDIKFAELAIGDYVAALGYMGESNILSVQRVLVTTKPELPEYTINLAKFSDVNSSDITKNTDIYQLTENNELEDISTKSISDDDQVILVTSTQDNETNLEAIFKI